MATAEDVIRLGGESPSAALATIDANIPPEFSGYEVRLFDSLTLRFVLDDPSTPIRQMLAETGPLAGDRPAYRNEMVLQ